MGDSAFCDDGVRMLQNGKHYLAVNANLFSRVVIWRVPAEYSSTGPAISEAITGLPVILAARKAKVRVE